MVLGKTYHEDDTEKRPSQSYWDGAKKYLSRSLTSSAIAGVGVTTMNSISKSLQ
ncbi:hypothetical protein BVRB_3g070630 [Beta vulgaris subsp. vulgaris]|uniref:Uncharacterized protein n=1 Tax=Beta vulgaris subsp. vulgaris TaxID=3555 RepID=A0A0J8E5V4_BETVV|nr:hypothetical protein BVRB_3g070630 [Beta vulgaris subsp. vulgaris]